MKPLHLTSNVDFIVPLFYGRVALNATKQELMAKFAGHDIACFTTKKGLNYLEIRIENATLNCFLNLDEACYTCWIFIDDLNDPEPYIQFYNKYLSFFTNNKNYWLMDGGAVELIKDKGRYYLVIV